MDTLYTTNIAFPCPKTSLNLYSEKNTKERANESTYWPSLSNTTSEGRSRLRMNRSSLKDGGWVSLQEITKRKKKTAYWSNKPLVHMARKGFA